MNQNFNYYGQADDVTLILCNPSGEQLMVLGTVYNRKVGYKFNAFSTLEFTAPYMINGVETPYYSLLQSKRLVLIDGIMCFLITGVTENGDGIQKYKDVTCQSLEATMNYKKVTSFEGTYQFYDALGTSGSPALINTILDYVPGWTVGTIDTSLSILYRTFDVDDTTLYSFLMSDVSKTYQCIFSFDTLNKTISAHTVDNATSNSDIFLSYDNLIKETKIEEITDELVTCLTVVGGGNLSINSVNPLGTNKIYDFSYYENTNWMSASLITALDTWEALIVANQANYADKLTTLQDYNETLISQQSELVDLQSEYDALENIKITRIAGGLDLIAINTQLASKQAEIDHKDVQIQLTQSQIAIVTADLTSINTALSFDANFTVSAQLELSNFMYGSTYTNENFIQTSLMTNSEVQDQAQGLYDQAIEALAKLSQPRYEFTLNSVNFIALQDYAVFTTQLELGTIVTVDLGGNSNIYENDYTPSTGSQLLVYPALLEIDMNYDDPSDFSLTFSNRLRLDDSAFQLSDFLGANNTSAISTSFNSEQWDSWTKDYQNTVSTFITSNLDAAVNNVTSGSTQNVLINQTGIRVRNLISASTTSVPAVYDPKQLWINNGIIAFSDDSFQTAKLAVGSIDVDGTPYYGVVGDYLIGHIVAANNLLVTNENNTFTLDGSGATLTNATFTLNTSNGNSKIFLDPANGIKIQKNVGGTWTNQLSMDTAGNLIMTGNITAPSGNIGGWNILSDRLQDNLSTPNYIRSDGYIRLGLLTITPTSATFGGTIYANNISGYLTSDQISSLIASKLTGQVTDSQVASGIGVSKIVDTSGNSVYDGTFRATQYNQLTGGIVYIGRTGDYKVNGTTLFSTKGGIVTSPTGANISVTMASPYNGDFTFNGILTVTDRTNSNITSSGTSYFYQTQYSGRATFNSDIYTGGSAGSTQVVTITDYFGLQRNFHFNHGIFTGM